MKTKSKIIGCATVLLPALVLSCQNQIGGPGGPTTSSGGDKTPAPPTTTSDNGNTFAGSFQTTFKGGDDTGWCSGCDLAVVNISFGDGLTSAEVVRRGPPGAASHISKAAVARLHFLGLG